MDFSPKGLNETKGRGKSGIGSRPNLVNNPGYFAGVDL
jgi:hypothetical protein